MLAQRRFPIAFVAGVLTTLAALWLWNSLPAPPAALAQVPDSGAQRNEQIAEQRITNQKLTEIAGLLREIRDQGRKDAKAAGRL